MQTYLEQEISNIKIKIFEMADLVIESIESSVTALKNSDIDLAQKIMKEDTVMDLLEIDIDNECIKLLVTRQPAASDLRFVLAMLKINTDLERMGDLATNIAKEVIKINGAPLMKPLIDIPRMSERAIQMIRLSFEAITEKDVDKAKKVILMDEEIDQLNLQIYRELFTFMSESAKNIPQSFSLILVAKALERIGDHAKNIAERGIYYIQGEDIRHRDVRETIE
jgi:phosphate transport system protein